MSSFPRDENGVTLADTDWGLKAEKTMTFAGGTANDPGDYDGSGNPATLFTVTGEVQVRLLAVCITSLAGGSATIEVGLSGNTAAVIALTTATNMVAGEFWHDASPDSAIEESSVLKEFIIVNGADIIQTVATANITSGAIKYTCLWYPLSIGAKVEAA